MDEVLRAAMQAGEMTVRIVHEAGRDIDLLSSLIAKLYRAHAHGTQVNIHALRNGGDIRAFLLPEEHLADFRQAAAGIGMQYAAVRAGDLLQIVVQKADEPNFHHIRRLLGIRESEVRPAQVAEEGVPCYEGPREGERYLRFTVPKEHAADFLKNARSSGLAFSSTARAERPAQMLRGSEILRETFDAAMEKNGPAGSWEQIRDAQPAALEMTKEQYSALRSAAAKPVPMAAAARGGKVYTAFRGADLPRVAGAVPGARKMNIVPRSELEERLAKSAGRSSIDVLIPASEEGRARSALEAAGCRDVRMDVAARAEKYREPLKSRVLRLAKRSASVLQMPQLMECTASGKQADAYAEQLAQAGIAFGRYRDGPLSRFAVRAENAADAVQILSGIRKGAEMTPAPAHRQSWWKEHTPVLCAGAGSVHRAAAER